MVRCRLAGERPEVGQAHWGHWVPWKDGGMLLPPWEKHLCLLPWRGLALFACRIGNKDQSGDFYLRKSCGIQGLASCQPSPAYTSIMCFIQQCAILTKKKH